MKNKVLLSLMCALIILASAGCSAKNVVSIENSRSLRDEKTEYTDSIPEMDYYIEKKENNNDIKFNEYYKGETRKIFLASNITDIIIATGRQKRDLNKFLLSDTKMSDFDIIHFMIRKLEKENVLKDGGTTIYRGKKKDITMIVCNTLDNNHDIYIGDYSTEYAQFMCS